MYLLGLFLLILYVPWFLMDNEFLHLCATPRVLQMCALMCTALMLPLLCPLFYVMNACSKCVTYIGFINAIMTE